jgi:hypothetical protein
MKLISELPNAEKCLRPKFFILLIESAPHQPSKRVSNLQGEETESESDNSDIDDDSIEKFDKFENKFSTNEKSNNDLLNWDLDVSYYDYFTSKNKYIMKNFDGNNKEHLYIDFIDDKFDSDKKKRKFDFNNENNFSNKKKKF